ncbi:MAG: PSD1 and planctomycete cytochrome C domain-containing protein [Pirellulales bacterium]
MKLLYQKAVWQRASSGGCRPCGAAFAVVAVILGLGLRLSADETQSAKPAAVDQAGTSKPTAASKIDFGRDIQPIFAKRCFACHGPDAFEGGLQLHKRDRALAELDSGERAIVPGNTEASAILERIASEDADYRMPPKGKPLEKDQAELIRRWIVEGAEWQSHWAFRPPQSRSPPAVKNQDWVNNPIDAFVLQRLEDNGLSPAPPADKVALIRRAYHDLTGLPPTPEEVDRFVADSWPDAYEKLVDRLLASPHYGERWGRHWLDLVRYAETNSFERDGPKQNAWRYRDYVIRSFNDDKPYDQFVREQLAGDELPDVTTDSIIATGFYRLGLWDDEPADMMQARFDELDDIVATTSQVFLGLTVNCARCHDHKLDPIPQADYYRLLAYFHEVYPFGTRPDQLTWNQTDLGRPEIAAQYEALEDERKQVREQQHEIEQRGIAKMPAEDQRKTEGDQRAAVLRDKLKEHLSDKDWQRYTELRSHARELRRKKLPPREMALSVKCMSQAPETFILQRGNPHVPGKKVEPGVPEIFTSKDPPIPERPPGAKSSGRRLALANWIASPDNMLTARVMANRVWQFHFGRGIVRSTNNFGQIGDRPTHPELLDWLAAELVRGGWRLKPLHRLIMLSSAYRMSSAGNADGLARDPTNDLFWRFDMRRLSAEEVRDSIHEVTGQLNTKMYGPSIYPEISAEVLAGQSMPGAGWGRSSKEEQARRSVYIHVKRSLITPILADFDFPETDSSCAGRFATVQPAQALGMLNGKFLHDQAEAFATRLRHEAGDDRRAQVTCGLRLAVLRQPHEHEVARGLKLMESLEKDHGVSDEAALKYFCLFVLNLNEFVYLD